MPASLATQAVLRDRFPILANSTYLVSHSMGAAPRDVKAALDRYFEEWAADGPEAWERWLPRIAEIADGIGSIIGAPPGSVFLAPNVSVLQAALATSLRFESPRNEVVYEALQFPSLTYVWTEWQRFGAQPRIVPSDDGRTVPTERIIAAITERTAIAVLSHAYYISGALCDVRAIQAHCRKTGTLLCVDACATGSGNAPDLRRGRLGGLGGGPRLGLLGDRLGGSHGGFVRDSLLHGGLGLLGGRGRGHGLLARGTCGEERRRGENRADEAKQHRPGKGHVGYIGTPWEILNAAVVDFGRRLSPPGPRPAWPRPATRGQSRASASATPGAPTPPSRRQTAPPRAKPTPQPA